MKPLHIAILGDRLSICGIRRHDLLVGGHRFTTLSDPGEFLPRSLPRLANDEEACSECFDDYRRLILNVKPAPKPKGCLGWLFS